MARARGWVGFLFGLAALTTLLCASAGPARAATVAVRYTEGVTRGFMVLRSSAGEVLARGDLLQVVREDGVDSRLVLHFGDGSLYEERAVFSQHRVFTLLRYHLVIRGPSFPEPMEVSLERQGKHGRYTVTRRQREHDAETVTGDTEMPPDVYNGMVPMLLRNLPAGAGTTVRVLAFQPKPTLVDLKLTPRGEERVAVGERRLLATHYVLEPRLGLVRGAAAALLGKAPVDRHCWIVTAGVPAFAALDAPLYPEGPVWRVETVSPQGPPPGGDTGSAPARPERDRIGSARSGWPAITPGGEAPR